MATVSTRVLWKGAISFGLVYIPVAMHSATEDSRPKMKLIDQESMSPIGHKNISKATGEEVSQEDIVKGMEVDKEQFVTLTKEEIREALPRTTQTIGIELFVKAVDVPMVFYSKPYYVSPVSKGQKPFALLREVLKRTGRVGVGRVVVSTKQHLAVVAPYGDGLVVNLVRWAEEVREMKGLPLPGEASSVGVTERELKMAEQLVLDLDGEWKPEEFKDEFREKVEQLVAEKRKTGQVTTLTGLVASEIMPDTSADVIDLTELLRRSLRAKTPEAERMARSAANEPAAHRRKAANDEEPKRAAAASKTADKARATVKPTKKGKPA